MKRFISLITPLLFSSYDAFLIMPYTIRNLLPIRTEPRIVLKSYLGIWYQVATSRSTALLGTGVEFTNVTAEYKLLNNIYTIKNKV